MGREGALCSPCSSIQQDSFCWDANPAQAQIIQGKGLYFWHSVWFGFLLVFFFPLGIFCHPKSSLGLPWEAALPVIGCSMLVARLKQLLQPGPGVHGPTSIVCGLLEGSTSRGSDGFLQDKGARLPHLLGEDTSLVACTQRRACLLLRLCCGQLCWPACNDYYLALLHCSVVMSAIYQAIPWWTGFDLNARVSRCFQPAPLTWCPRRLSWKAG